LARAVSLAKDVDLLTAEGQRCGRIRTSAFDSADSETAWPPRSLRDALVDVTIRRRSTYDPVMSFLAYGETNLVAAARPAGVGHYARCRSPLGVDVYPAAATCGPRWCRRKIIPIPFAVRSCGRRSSPEFTDGHRLDDRGRLGAGTRRAESNRRLGSGRSRSRALAHATA